MNRVEQIVSHLSPNRELSHGNANLNAKDKTSKPKTKTVRVTKVFTNSQGDSELGSFDVTMSEGGHIGFLSQRLATNGIIFRETPGTYDYDWHPAPRRQFIINLDAAVKITTSTGQEKVLPPGEVFFVEDTSGKGHKSQAVDGKTRRSVFIPVPESFDSNTNH